MFWRRRLFCRLAELCRHPATATDSVREIADDDPCRNVTATREFLTFRSDSALAVFVLCQYVSTPAGWENDWPGCDQGLRMWACECRHSGNTGTGVRQDGLIIPIFSLSRSLFFFFLYFLWCSTNQSYNKMTLLRSIYRQKNICQPLIMQVVPFKKRWEVCHVEHQSRQNNNKKKNRNHIIWFPSFIYIMMHIISVWLLTKVHHKINRSNLLIFTCFAHTATAIVALCTLRHSASHSCNFQNRWLPNNFLT